MIVLYAHTHRKIIINNDLSSIDSNPVADNSRNQEAEAHWILWQYKMDKQAILQVVAEGQTNT